jgi:CheY-like chemotaxis protein
MAAFQPDVVLLDVIMPELDGYGVLEAMQQNPDFSSIPACTQLSRGASASGAPVFILATRRAVCF